MKGGININLTWSKIMAFVIIAASIWLTLELESVTPFSIGVPAASALILGKQAQTAYIKKKEDGEGSNKH